MTVTAGEHGATLIPYEDGPLLLRGDFTLRTPDGKVIDPGRGTVALCRCGRSAIKPFCDGTHKAIGFRAGTGRDTPAPRGDGDADSETTGDDSARPAYADSENSGSDDNALRDS